MKVGYANLKRLVDTYKKDIDKIIAAFRNLENTCKACHKKFRN